MHKLKVEGHEGLYRDPHSNAIINENVSEYETFLKRRNAFLANKKKIEEQSSEISTLKDELSEIKFLLNKLLENKQ